MKLKQNICVCSYYARAFAAWFLNGKRNFIKEKIDELTINAYCNEQKILKVLLYNRDWGAWNTLYKFGYLNIQLNILFECNIISKVTY